jgi:hypothetical protein
MIARPIPRPGVDGVHALDLGRVRPDATRSAPQPTATPSSRATTDTTAPWCAYLAGSKLPRPLLPVIPALAPPDSAISRASAIGRIDRLGFDDHGLRPTHTLAAPLLALRPMSSQMGFSPAQCSPALTCMCGPEAPPPPPAPPPPGRSSSARCATTAAHASLRHGRRAETRPGAPARTVDSAVQRECERSTAAPPPTFPSPHCAIEMAPRRRRRNAQVGTDLFAIQAASSVVSPALHGHQQAPPGESIQPHAPRRHTVTAPSRPAAPAPASAVSSHRCRLSFALPRISPSCLAALSLL